MKKNKCEYWDLDALGPDAIGPTTLNELIIQKPNSPPDFETSLSIENQTSLGFIPKENILFAINESISFLLLKDDEK